MEPTDSYKPHDAPGPLARAAVEARFLLGRGYGREQVLSLVGDHHQLGEMDRRALRRGAYAPDAAQARRARLLGLKQARGRSLAVDGHNQLITLCTALAGGRLVLGDDGVVRDLGELGKNRRPLPDVVPAAAWLLKAARDLGVADVYIYLDEPLPKSGELAGRLRGMLKNLGLDGDARALRLPQKELRAHEGPVCSSCSVLLDEVEQPMDLAGVLIQGMQPAPELEEL